MKFPSTGVFGWLEDMMNFLLEIKPIESERVGDSSDSVTHERGGGLSLEWPLYSNYEGIVTHQVLVFALTNSWG